MNAAAFQKSEALQRLENYSSVVVEHLALLTWFGDSSASSHWQVEINAFVKTLRRYDKGKKRKHNFKTDDIIDALMDQVHTNDDKDAVLIGIEGHGVKAPEDPAWEDLYKAFEEFAQKVLS